MTADEFLGELLRESAWRFEEVQHLNNLVTREPNEERQASLRKSLIMLLYAHLEGFVVFALDHYRTAINTAGVRCGEVTPEVLAGAWDLVFKAMQLGDAKCRVFLKPLPHDEILHRQWRRRHFIEEVSRFEDAVLEMPEDLIDATSNLTPQVLQRNLFVLGLDHQFVVPHADNINKLLGQRNRIAHGDNRRGISLADYSKYESSVKGICEKLVEHLDAAYREQRYLKPHPDYSL